MCGIFALMSDVDFNLIDTEFRKGKDRGPEHSIIHNEKIMNMKSKFYLGFHRLAINGLNTESNQPLMMDNIILICNGEIYNYKELYKMLDVKPKTDSDCEVIIHLYKKYGFEQTLQMLDGVFAFILIDLNRKMIFIARDTYGVRPLFVNTFTCQDEMGRKKICYGFSSVPKSLDGFHNSKHLQQFEPGSYSIFNIVRLTSLSILLHSNNENSQFSCTFNAIFLFSSIV